MAIPAVLVLAHVCSISFVLDLVTKSNGKTSHKWQGIDKYTAKIIKWEMEMANKKLRIILFFLCINHLVFQHRI